MTFSCFFGTKSPAQLEIAETASAEDLEKAIGLKYSAKAGDSVTIGRAGDEYFAMITHPNDIGRPQILKTEQLGPKFQKVMERLFPPSNERPPLRGSFTPGIYRPTLPTSSSTGSPPLKPYNLRIPSASTPTPASPSPSQASTPMTSKTVARATAAVGSLAGFGALLHSFASKTVPTNLSAKGPITTSSAMTPSTPPPVPRTSLTPSVKKVLDDGLSEKLMTSHKMWPALGNPLSFVNDQAQKLLNQMRSLLPSKYAFAGLIIIAAGTLCVKNREQIIARIKQLQLLFAGKKPNDRPQPRLPLPPYKFMSDPTVTRATQNNAKAPDDSSNKLGNELTPQEEQWKKLSPQQKQQFGTAVLTRYAKNLQNKTPIQEQRTKTDPVKPPNVSTTQNKSEYSTPENFLDRFNSQQPATRASLWANLSRNEQEKTLDYVRKCHGKWDILAYPAKEPVSVPPLSPPPKAPEPPTLDSVPVAPKAPEPAPASFSLINNLPGFDPLFG